MGLKLSNKDIILVKNNIKNSNTGMSSVWRTSSIMLKCGINGIKNRIFNGERLLMFLSNNCTNKILLFKIK
jgi:hypothetical protein